MRVGEAEVKQLLLTLLLVVWMAGAATAQEVVFSGLPVVAIDESGNRRVVTQLDSAESSEYRCVITKDGDRYYWKSRGNVLMVPTVSGIYTTYVAVTGAGYVRTIDPQAKDIAVFNEGGYDYVEHILMGFVSFTYYGVREKYG